MESSRRRSRNRFESDEERPFDSDANKNHALG
jgi:hypothetical protein